MDFKKLPKGLAEKMAMAQNKEMLTRCPDVNNLIRVIQELKEDSGKVDDLRKHLDNLYQLHNNMLLTFDFLSKTQPPTEVSKSRLPMIKENLIAFKEALDEIALYFEDNDFRHIDSGLDSLIYETDDLFESTDILKKDEEAIPSYSDSPMISELIRIGKGVADGLYEPETLKRRLDLCKTFHKESVDNLKDIMCEPFDTEESEQESPLIMESLDLMKEGLDEIEMFFQDDDEEHIFEGIELVRQAAEELSSSYKIIKSAVDKAENIGEEKKEKSLKEKICFKCGLKLKPQVKICPKCHIPIPDIKEDDPCEEDVTPVVDFAESKHTETPMMTPNVKRIYDTVTGFIEKKVSREKFIEDLNWLDGLLCQNEETLKKEKIPEFHNEREKEIYFHMKQLFETGIRESRDGISEMKIYLNDEDINHINKGIMMTIKGGEKLYQVQMVTKRIQQDGKESKK